MYCCLPAEHNITRIIWWLCLSKTYCSTVLARFWQTGWLNKFLNQFCWVCVTGCRRRLSSVVASCVISCGKVQDRIIYFYTIDLIWHFLFYFLDGITFVVSKLGVKMWAKLSRDSLLLSSLLLLHFCSSHLASGGKLWWQWCNISLKVILKCAVTETCSRWRGFDCLTSTRDNNRESVGGLCLFTLAKQIVVDSSDSSSHHFLNMYCCVYNLSVTLLP